MLCNFSVAASSLVVPVSTGSCRSAGAKTDHRLADLNLGRSCMLHCQLWTDTSRVWQDLLVLVVVDGCTGTTSEPAVSSAVGWTAHNVNCLSIKMSRGPIRWHSYTTLTTRNLSTVIYCRECERVGGRQSEIWTRRFLQRAALQALY